jgi:hypothetical protein
MAYLNYMGVLTLLLVGTGCASSVGYTVRRQAEQELQCDCGPMELNDVTGKLKRPEDGLRDQRFYQAKCCGREATYECVAFIGGPYNHVEPPLPDQGPTGDVAWRCWSIESPGARKKPAAVPWQPPPPKPEP